MTTLEAIETESLRRDLPPFRTGDTVRVHVKVREGDKERIQMFEGVVIRRRKGGASSSFTVRKVSYGVGVERIFPLQSPSVEKVEIRSRGHVRRSRLYFLRELRGKKARLRSKVRDLSQLVSPEDREAQEAGYANAAQAAEAAAKAEEERQARAAAEEEARAAAAAETEAAEGSAEEAGSAEETAPAEGEGEKKG